MQKLNAADYVRICAGLQAMRHAVSEIPASTPADRRLTKPLLDAVGDACVALNLKASVALLVRTVMAVYGDKMSHGQFLAAVKELESRIMGEMDARLYFCLNDDSVRYYDAKNAFGDEVAAAFPSATLDIEEAGNCLALNRYTACVLHLMRAMEPVIYAVATSIGLTYEFKGWDAVIRKMRTELEKSYPDMDDAFRGKKEFYSNVLDRLLATKDALRNPAMHARMHYDAERAEDVYRATRSLMKAVAAGLKEEDRPV